MEIVKLDWSKMTADQIITVWLKPDEPTDTIDGRITNLQWCEKELKRIQKKGKNAVLVERESGDIALLRR